MAARYDRVYVWTGSEWLGRTVPHDKNAKTQNENAREIRDRFLTRGYPAVLGSSTIGAPEGPPTHALDPVSGCTVDLETGEEYP